MIGFNLEALNLCNNNLSGSIPDFGHNNLISINLSHNKLSGYLPTSYSKDSKLQSIELNDNLLEGELPAEMGNLANLGLLWLQNNLLDGCYHPNLKSICEKSGFVMDVSNNDFDATWEDFCDDNLGICISPNSCRISDSLNLLVLSNSIKGLDDWEINQPIKNWEGVELNIDGCVKGLHLCDDAIIDIIPPEIGNFSELEYLCLAENNIKGEIPAEIGNLKKLRRLNLNENELSGEIPVEIANLKYLEYIDLSYNNLTGFIPSEIGLLTNLEIISLRDNDLYGDLSFVGSLKNLQTLSLGENNLTGSIPNEINTLINLEVLLLNNNNLTGFLPDDFLNEANITYMDVSHNFLQGCYPESMRQLCADNFSISEGNNFTISFNDFCFEDNFEENWPCDILPDCRWSDSLTLITVHQSLKNYEGADFWNFEQPMDTWRGVKLNEQGCVKSIKMFEEAFDGTLPSAIGYLSNLETLIFYDCFINGNIPAEIGNLRSLKELNLQWNDLNGEIPAEIGELFNLKSLVLDGNELSGAIPTELSALKQLEHLDLRNNNLTGSIPPLLSTLPRLESLDLTSNNLSGCFHPLLKSFCSQLGPLAHINDGNNFVADWFSFCDEDAGKCAPPPCQMVDSLALVSLYLKTEGPNWPDYRQWNFSEPMNTWSGITLNYDGCVQQIDLSFGNLKGDFPTEVTNMIFLEELDLSRNELTGNIPTQILSLTDLKTLNLAGNELSGAIPEEISNLLKLQTVNLNGNQLTGGIPGQFVNLPELENFEVSYNQLSECYPVELTLWCDNPNFNEWQISEGNNFPAPWSAFCLEGECSQGGIVNPCRVNDSLSLLALNNSMPVFEWDTSQPINTWPWVTLNPSGCVSSIVLDNAAFGMLPPEIGNFSELEVLTIIIIRERLLILFIFVHLF